MAVAQGGSAVAGEVDHPLDADVEVGRDREFGIRGDEDLQLYSRVPHILRWTWLRVPSQPPHTESMACAALGLGLIRGPRTPRTPFARSFGSRPSPA